jgi:hypothetical protein
MAVLDGAFGDLRRLADWFSTSPHHRSLHIERMCKRLGATAVPLLGRELRGPDSRRREAARACLALIAVAADARPRVLAELRSMLEGALHDELKVCVLGLMNELGERAEAKFEDPRAMQKKSALALAAQLETAAEVANAADMMIRQLADDDIAQMVEVLSEAAPEPAQRLASELALRLDLAEDVRERIVAMMAPAYTPTFARRPQRAAQVAVLVDAPCARSVPRIVVVASKKLVGERRWRRWAVLIGPAKHIEECLHEEVFARAGGEDADHGPLVANLVADGYRIVSTDLDHARTVVAAAARISAARPDPSALPSAYYLGRDLLDLADAHLGSRRDTSSLVLARAIELISDGECTRALALLERCPDQASADHAAAVAACALLQGRPGDAIEPLQRAIAGEPAWPLHHWNLAAAFHALGDLAGCYHALRRFLTTSARPTAVDADPDQTGRVASAERMLGELQRAARLTNTSLRRRRAKKPKASQSSG